MAKNKNINKFKKLLLNTDKKKNTSVSHTKGYYRFSKDFPSVADSDGYRDNEVFKKSPEKKAALKKKLAGLFLIVFLLTFAGTALSFSVANLPVKETETGTEIQESPVLSPGIKAVFLTGDVLSYTNTQSLTQELSSLGVNAVVIEFKDSDGYIYFRPSSSVITEALYRVSERAAETVESIKNSGLQVFASFSCFGDSIYARNNQDAAAYILSEEQSGEMQEARALWYSHGDGSCAWISPYSDTVTSYLLSIIQDIASMGVDGIILNNVMLPYSEKNESVIFPGQPSENPDVNKEAADFVSLVKSRVSCPVGAEISLMNAVNITEGKEENYLFLSGADYIAVDSRLSTVPKNISVNGKTFEEPGAKPYMFMLETYSSLLSFADKTDFKGSFLPVIEASGTSADEISAVSAQGVNSYIMYSESMSFSPENFKK